MQHTSYEVIERRTKLLELSAKGISTKLIAKELNISLEQVYKDIAAIKKQGVKFLSGLTTKEKAYAYQNMITNILNVNKQLWELSNKKDISDADSIKAYKVIIEGTIALSELLSKSINIFEVEQLKQTVNNITNNLQVGNTSNTGYMNLNLPHLIKEQTDNNNPITITK